MNDALKTIGQMFEAAALFIGYAPLTVLPVLGVVMLVWLLPDMLRVGTPLAALAFGSSTYWTVQAIRRQLKEMRA